MSLCQNKLCVNYCWPFNCKLQKKCRIFNCLTIHLMLNKLFLPPPFFHVFTCIALYCLHMCTSAQSQASHVPACVHKLCRLWTETVLYCTELCRYAHLLAVTSAMCTYAHMPAKHAEKHPRLIGLRSHNVCPSVSPAQSFLEQSIFIFLGHEAIREQSEHYNQSYTVGA